MKKIVLIITAALTIFSFNVNGQKHKIKITLDTKKMVNAGCSLGADGVGGPSTLTKVYMHSGVCTCRLTTALQRDCGTTTENRNYCISEISPYQSNVWQHVVGDWGENPQDNGKGLMTNDGNGVYSIEFIIEDYYSDPNLISTESNTSTSAVQSTLMPDGAVPYVMGVVFRNEDGTLSGRDNECYDIFIVDVNTESAYAVQGSSGEAFDPVSVDVTLASINDIERLTKVKAYPNPMTDATTIDYFIRNSSENVSIKIYNSIGQEVRDLFSGYKASGSYKIFWNGKDNKGNNVFNGVYYVTISDGKKVLYSNRIVVLDK